MFTKAPLIISINLFYCFLQKSDDLLPFIKNKKYGQSNEAKTDYIIPF